MIPITAFAAGQDNLALTDLERWREPQRNWQAHGRAGIETPMDLQTWSKSNAKYSRRLLHAAVDGARSGQESFLNGKPLAMYLDESARNAWKPAALAACLGLLGVYPTGSRKSRGKALAYGCLGGLVGFGAAIAWENRRLAASVVSSAWKKMSRVRDEHWLEVNPIDYA